MWGGRLLPPHPRSSAVKCTTEGEKSWLSGIMPRTVGAQFPPQLALPAAQGSPAPLCEDWINRLAVDLGGDAPRRAGDSGAASALTTDPVEAPDPHEMSAEKHQDRGHGLRALPPLPPQDEREDTTDRQREEPRREGGHRRYRSPPFRMRSSRCSMMRSCSGGRVLATRSSFLWMRL